MDTTAQRPITIAILAMGGEGGGVLAEWIVDAAEHAGFIAQMTSVPGVAQRTGATNYYVELFPKLGARSNALPPVLGLTPVPGDVDVVIASELMEAGRAVQRGLVTPNRTTFIVSTNRVYSMTERIAMADGRADSAALLEGCKSAAKTIIHGDLAQLAEATGSVISAVLFGALAGSKVLPMQRMAFEAAIHRGGVGVKQSIAAFGAGYAAAEGGPQPVKAEAAVIAHISPTLAPLMAETGSAAEPARMFMRLGIEKLADYQDAAYARDYLDRLKPIAETDKRHGNGSGMLLAEVARELALGMAYEDTVRVAELKIRPSRFERVRAEVQAADGQIVEIAEFLHPRVQEIADTLPASTGRWLLNTGWARRFVERLTKSGRVVKTSSIRGFLQLYAIAALKPKRRRSLRYANEQAFLHEWLRTIQTVAATNYALATEIATARTLVKGYSDTHERGRRSYDMLMQMLPRIMEMPDPAAALAALRKAALADDTGTALGLAIKDIRPLPQAAE
ncbi:MAG: indolepyruvate oxidoreductase subunit beta family protein [Alphaproteobacteria bacterium]|nr:indolepyruvate oxidoreductase subunit beta family protein [Alphaproteobacteria bacterium]